MKNGEFSLKRCCFLVLVFLLIGTSLFLGSADRARAAMEWEALHFEPGQKFTYNLLIEMDGMEIPGQVILKIVPTGIEEFEISMEGELAGEVFSSTARGETENPVQTFINLATAARHDLPEMVFHLLVNSLLLPWAETPLYTAELSPDWDWEDPDDDVLMEVTGQQEFAGRQGFLVQIGSMARDEFFFMGCIDPELPLPLMGAVMGMGGVNGAEETSFQVELVEFARVDVDEVAAAEERAPSDDILGELVDYFAASGLEVGERQMKAYGMLGAAAGFGIEVEGDEIELYLFDPDTADEETLEYLEIARDSGKFKFVGMNMEIPVVINGYIMLTGLEFGSAYVHPARDMIVEIFKDF